MIRRPGTCPGGSPGGGEALSGEETPRNHPQRRLTKILGFRILKKMLSRRAARFVCFGGLLLAGSLAAAAAGGDYFKKKYDPFVKNASFRYGIDANLIHAVIQAESAYNRWAVSIKGARGLMQLIPETAAFYGVADVFDPEQNINGGVKYLRDLSALYGGRTDLILAAYNAGQNAVKKYGGIPPYAETREYIHRVMASYSKPYISGGAPIRKFVDPSGQHVFTNDPYYHLNNRKNPD